MPPDNSQYTDPPAKSDISVIASSGNAKSPKKAVFFIAGLLLLIVGIITSVFLVQRRQQIQISATDCGLYNFYVSREGIVTVTNNQGISEQDQMATVLINGSQVATLRVEPLDPYESATLGTVEIPESGNFTWSVTGDLFCSDSGEYTEIETTPTEIPATPTVSPEPTAEVWPFSCGLYNFDVSDTGIVTVTNDMTHPAQPQDAKVYINNVLTDTFPAPGLSAGQTATLGTATIPASGTFHWLVRGSVACADDGNRVIPTPPVNPSPTIPAATPTAPITPSPSPIPNSPTPTSKITVDAPPAPPNRCNGSCTTDANCTYGEDNVKLICVNRLCRHPSCTDQESCHCPASVAAAPTPKASGATLAQSGVVSPTLMTGFAGFILLGLSLLLAL